MTIIGLKHKKVYKTARRLRYGKIILMGDPDVAGQHFSSLIINWIHSYWPSLLEINGFISVFESPLFKVKVFSTGEEKEFYSNETYQKWLKYKNLGKADVKVKHYRGLGACTPDEAAKYFSNISEHLRELKWGGADIDSALELAHGANSSDERKLLISKLESEADLFPEFELFCDSGAVEEKSFTRFIKKVLVITSLDALKRHIPSMVDGFKPTQRKIIWTAFERNIMVESTLVSVLSGQVAFQAAYRHAPESLCETIIRMAQNFWCSNNLNLLEPDGQFGTRLFGGKDHAGARYIHTRLCSVTEILFPESDRQLLEYLNECGKTVEPKWYIPIVPLILVNGCWGVATGWKTYIPSFSVKHFVLNLKRLLNGESMESMMPYFKGFKGKIVKNGEGVFEAHGLMERNEDGNTVQITELPLVWTDLYNQQLASPSSNIEILEDNCNVFSVDYKLKVKRRSKVVHTEKSLYKTFKLVHKISTRNMLLFDRDGVLKLYERPETSKEPLH